MRRTESAKTGHAPGQFPHRLHRFITLTRRRHHALRKRLQTPSGLGQHQPAIGTDEHMRAQMLFQTQDLFGKGGL
ncbi:hypothetical protein D3C78_1607250 [compost metagenome]